MGHVSRREPAVMAENSSVTRYRHCYAGCVPAGSVLCKLATLDSSSALDFRQDRGRRKGEGYARLGVVTKVKRRLERGDRRVEQRSRKRKHLRKSVLYIVCDLPPLRIQTTQGIIKVRSLKQAFKFVSRVFA